MRSLFLFLFALFLIFPSSVSADQAEQNNAQESFTRAEVLKVYAYKLKYIGKYELYDVKIQIKLLEGNEKDKIILINRSGDPKIKSGQIKTGDHLVINSRIDRGGEKIYSIYEIYRLNNIWLLLAGFIVLIVLIGGRKGIGAFIGLAISLIIISYWMVPQLLAGLDPLQTVTIAASVILLFTTYIAHGFSLKTTIAVVGTAAALFFTGWLSTILVDAFSLFGLGNEDIYQLQAASSVTFNTQGLLLGAILIGTLGALNDITTTQSASVFAFIKENPDQKLLKLFGKGMNIGKEHIASLINTLVLAYTGASLGIFFFYNLNPAHLPWWVILNNEATMEEIIATLVGSSALILAVPFTTFLAAFVALRGTTFSSFFNNIFNAPKASLVKNKK